MIEDIGKTPVTGEYVKCVKPKFDDGDVIEGHVYEVVAGPGDRCPIFGDLVGDNAFVIVDEKGKFGYCLYPSCAYGEWEKTQKPEEEPETEKKLKRGRYIRCIEPFVEYLTAGKEYYVEDGPGDISSECGMVVTEGCCVVCDDDGELIHVFVADSAHGKFEIV